MMAPDGDRLFALVAASGGPDFLAAARTALDYFGQTKVQRQRCM